MKILFVRLYNAYTCPSSSNAFGYIDVSQYGEWVLI
jgi:hypothetical protein